ncbi:Muskelin N-terminus-domain-containing protein [Pilobolus umbonatus]|nr:Muskelin N-terminus-domain-containing protein [Pilobolus umbonatus]
MWESHHSMLIQLELKNWRKFKTMVNQTADANLKYTVYGCSSYSGSYYPHNICVDLPTEQSSRWSSGLHDRDQYITIQFDSPVVARVITFGKFYKGHVCNLKEFKVFGGMDPAEEMTELLHSGLRNDTEPESFTLKHSTATLALPVKYIKIVPLSAFGANFNYSIWYIEVKGIIDEIIMEKVCSEFDYVREIETIRLCLKHFRKRNMMNVYTVLKESTGVQLEDPWISELYQHLVIDTDIPAAERLLQEAYFKDIYQFYSDQSSYTTHWKQLHPESKGILPSPRGGHQMCIDVKHGKIYMLGGWDGQRDLADFWEYDIEKNIWNIISHNTLVDGGPSARSCHKLCYDPKDHSIFVLGRYVEPQAAGLGPVECDFFRYYIEYNEWIQISQNTSLEGGPELIFDHQMCIDHQNAMLYVFGGRIVSSDPNVHKYSGFFSYNINTNTWALLREDELKCDPTKASPTTLPLKSRVGHSMMMDEKQKVLYMYAGQRVKDYLSDLYKYNTETNELKEIIQDQFKESGHKEGFTQRATLDSHFQEIYVLSGYMRSPGCDVVRNAFWVYSIKRNEWKKIYQNESYDHESWMATNGSEPCPRFAHQIVYNPKSCRHYIFGGNPGDSLNSNKRLNDLWELELKKPNPESLLKRCFYLIHMQRLKELCRIAYRKGNPDNEISTETKTALDYLRNKVLKVVNEDDEKENYEIQQMCTSLCLTEDTWSELDMKQELFSFINGNTKDTLFAERTRLFESILEYIPDIMKEPSSKLTSAAKLI